MTVDKLLAQSEKFLEAPPPAAEDDGRRSVSPPPAEKAINGSDKTEARKFEKKRLGEGKVELDKAKLERALAEEKKRKQQEEEEQAGGGFRPGKKGRYNNAADAGGSDEVTEEQLEAYRLAKSHDADDPMAKLKDDELLPM